MRSLTTRPAVVIGHAESGERRQISEEVAVGQFEEIREGEDAVTGRGAGGRDVPFVEDREPVGQFLRLLQVVRGQHHGRAAVAQRAHQLPGVPAPFGVQAGRRLVEEEDLGAAEQREGQVQAPFLAPGQLLHPYPGPPGVPGPSPGPDRLAGSAVQPVHIRTVSATVSSEGKPPSCSITPIRGRTAARSSYGSCPRTRTRPPAGGARPSSSLMVEVLPRRWSPAARRSHRGPRRR